MANYIDNWVVLRTVQEGTVRDNDRYQVWSAPFHNEEAAVKCAEAAADHDAAQTTFVVAHLTASYHTKRVLIGSGTGHVKYGKDKG